MTGASSGFTLLEVMVALAIFAVVSLAVMKSAAMSVRQTTAIQERSLAWWLAEDAMTKLRVRPRTESNYPAPGVSRERVRMSDIEWTLETRIETTENDQVRRVEISVHPYAREGRPAATLVGFLGRY